jgi:choline dehydrogenase-like flavoprotein
MEHDARQFAEGTTLDADVCIVGAGPAGLVLAAELSRGQHSVILLESGGDRPEPEIRALNDGDLSGDVYAGLGPTRHRQVGGTSQLWNTGLAMGMGAKYAPLDAADFESRASMEHSGWPFGVDEIRADYERAQRICSLGQFEYDATVWTRPGAEPWSDLGEGVLSRVYQAGARDDLLAPLLADIQRSSNVRLCTHATAIALHRDVTGREISKVSVSTPGGAPWQVHARIVVLAAGAVENARILLVSDDGTGVFGNRSGWVGRGFMEHPRDRSLTLRPRSTGLYEQSGFYDLGLAQDGTWIIGRIALRDDVLSSGALLNSSATLFPRLGTTARQLRALMPAVVQRWLPGEGHGWSRRRDAHRVFDGFTVMLNVEQPPHPENRVTLSKRRDALGVPLPALHWQWYADDRRRLELVRAHFSRALEGVGVMSVDASAIPDPNAHHHAGTTRMSHDPSFGVTDADGRVHGMENLYVAGASTFPTAGFANPMLTIVALAVRLARHIMQER